MTSPAELPTRFEKWESESALLAHLDTCESRTLGIGLDAEAPRAFYSIEVGSGEKANEIGIILSWHGIAPSAVQLGNRRRLLVGHDASVTWIEFDSLRVASSRRLAGVFFEFLPVGRDDEIVVLHELGALRVDADGSVKWSVDTDVVESSRIDENESLVLTILDAPDVVVSLISGLVTNQEATNGP